VLTAAANETSGFPSRAAETSARTSLTEYGFTVSMTRSASSTALTLSLVASTPSCLTLASVASLLAVAITLNSLPDLDNPFIIALPIVPAPKTATVPVKALAVPGR